MDYYYYDDDDDYYDGELLQTTNLDSDSDSDELLQTVLLEQSHELAAAKTLESDLDLAFQLQMQEALNTSVALHHSPPSSSTPTPFHLPNDDVTDLVAEEIARFEREQSDREQAEAEMQRMRDDLGRRIHDQAFARDLSRIGDAEWAEAGDYVVRPYGEGSSSSGGEALRLYFKGLVREETIRGIKKTTSAGVGIAICDIRDDRVFGMRKPLVCGGGGGGGDMSPEVVEVKALILGLEAAVNLGIKCLTVFCGDSTLHQYLTGKSIPRQGNLATLVGQATLLQRKFTYCSSELVRQKDIKFALKLANEALVSQVTWPEASTSTRNMKETCPICVDDLDGGKMFSITGCLHRYCYSCMKSHVHVKLVQGMLPKCPHDGCKTDLTLKMCKTFLTPELYDIMKQRVIESAIAATDKIYCPYPRCSALMSRTEVSGNTRAGGSSKCKKCHGLFCLHCKVPWHNNMSCGAYKRSNPVPSAEDAKLKSLARKNLWRQCVKCSHMVELGEGCNHISCRCGHQFCYVCGAEWRNKKATCRCPLWDEQRIIYERNRQRQRRG